ncbi:hypothetical protein B7494_g6316 [Chlorociboria aeruginascens]|nr:hypothetical protein B7494_g6316 [Chlorociboria aeruginascens]
MKLFRIQSLCWLSALITQISAITFLGVLQSYPELSTLYGYINASANATGQIASANNFTFLAASNDAIATFTQDNPSVATEDLLETILQYSLLQGGFPTLSFTNTSQFVPSNLVNATYANVTGGQVVELVLDASGTPEIVTGNKTLSTSTSTVCGIIHIVNEVLSIPLATVTEITAARFEFLISILNLGGFLNTNAVYVNEVLELPDVTYFLPNTAEALGNFTNIARNSSATALQAAFQYHIVPDFVGYSSLLTNGLSLKTAQGSNVTVTIQDGDMFINSAKVIASDYLVANGVVHVLDSLLNQFDTSPPPVPVATTSPIPTIAPTPTPTPTPTAITFASVTPSASHSSGLTTGAKIGIGVGVGIAGLIGLAGLAGYLLRSRKQKRESRAWGEQNMSGLGSDPGKFYVNRGTVQKQGDLGLGVHNTISGGVSPYGFEAHDSPEVAEPSTVRRE